MPPVCWESPDKKVNRMGFGAMARHG